MVKFRKLYTERKKIMNITLTTVMSFLLIVLKAVVVGGIGILLAKIAGNITAKAVTKAHGDISLVKFLSKSVRIAIYILTFIATLTLLGIPTTGLVAAMSAAAVAISLALKDSLSNISGGIFLLVTRPFITNDVIEVNGYCGSVKEIQLIHTVILTFDNREVIIPNGVMVNSTVINMSNEDRRRVDIVFSIGYDDNASLARELILKTASKHELVISEPEPFARVTAHSASSIDITMRVWTLAGDYWTVYFDLLEQVREQFNENGISIPYNQLDVHVDGFVNNTNT